MLVEYILGTIEDAEYKKLEDGRRKYSGKLVLPML